MSAIAGIYYVDDRSVDRADLVMMIDILAHRGPDGSNVWSEGPIGLGHRMLWSTPESLWEQLPLINQTGDIVLTADARIDNRDELIAALVLNDCPSEKITDSELILAAYEKWGESCPEQLIGDFAFVIWDGCKQELFCVRDHFGVKPFYYYSSGETFVFATEIKALLCLPEVPRQLNEVRVTDYLVSIFNDPTITFYQDILRLPAAHSMTVSHEGTRLSSYWSLDPSREVRLGSDEEYAKAFREIFTEAVRCRLRSAFPVGSMLSGGLDSSSITCVARKLLVQNGGQPLPTFSVIFDDPKSDERPFIEPVLAQGNIEPHYMHGDQRNPLTDLDRIFWHEDEVFFAPGLSVMSWGLCNTASQQGIRVLLSGHDGDGTVSHGFGYLSELARAGRWLTLAIELKGLVRIYNESFWGVLWKYIYYYALAPIIFRFKPLKLVQRILQALLRKVRRGGNRSAIPAWSATLNPDFIKRAGLSERYKSQQQTESKPTQSERESHYQTVTHSLQPFALEVLDKVAAAFSIEHRYPFWDKRLVEFCLALPPEQKLHRGWSRMIMRRAMANILPMEVQWRRDKLNFFPVFYKGLLLACQQESLNETILNDSGLLEKYVDITAFREAYHRFISGECQEMPEHVGAIWRVVSLALWLRYTGSLHKLTKIKM